MEALLVRLDRVVHSDMHHGEVEGADLARAYGGTGVGVPGGAGEMAATYSATATPFQYTPDR